MKHIFNYKFGFFFFIGIVLGMLYVLITETNKVSESDVKQKLDEIFFLFHSHFFVMFLVLVKQLSLVKMAVGMPLQGGHSMIKEEMISTELVIGL